MAMPDYPIFSFPDDMPDRPSGLAPNGRPMSEWGMLARGKTLGKSAMVIAPNLARGIPQFAETDMFEIKGEDEYALTVGVTLLPLLRTPTGAVLPDNLQSVSDTQNNAQLIGEGTYPWMQAVAIVQWGIGGQSAEAEVDIGLGTRFNLQASFIRIRGMLENPLTSNPLPAYQLRAFVGPGFDNPPATRTHTISGIASGITSAVREIPAFAKKAYVTGAPTAPGTLVVCRIQFYRRSGPGQQIGDYFFSGNNPLPVPIPNGAQYYTITNESGVTILGLSTIFELAL